MELEWGFSDIVIENNSNITFVRWKNNKIVTAASILYGQSPLKKAQNYVEKKHDRVGIEQSQNIYQYNQCTGGVDHLVHYFILFWATIS